MKHCSKSAITTETYELLASHIFSNLWLILVRNAKTKSLFSLR